MAMIEWDKESERLYETGVSKGAIFVYDDGKYGKPEAWNGLTSVSESPSGAEATKLYADDMQYLNMYSAEELGATIEAYMYPEAFEKCDGTAQPVAGMSIGQQARKTFGFAFETVVGNDTDGNAYGKKLHILYGCKASPSEKSYSTINDSPEAITFSWTITTTPVVATINGTEYKTASIIVDSTKVGKEKFEALEALVYDDTKDMPTINEVYTLLSSAG